MRLCQFLAQPHFLYYRVLSVLEFDKWCISPYNLVNSDKYTLDHGVAFGKDIIFLFIAS